MIIIYSNKNDKNNRFIIFIIIVILIINNTITIIALIVIKVYEGYTCSIIGDDNCFRGGAYVV